MTIQEEMRLWEEFYELSPDSPDGYEDTGWDIGPWDFIEGVRAELAALGYTEEVLDRYEYLFSVVKGPS